MSPNVQTEIARLQVREGGVVTQKDGPAGASQTTWFGQTAGWLQEYGLAIPASPSQAAENWYAFLVKEHLDAVLDFHLELGDVVVDACVNDGAAEGIEMLQRALGVTVDGAMDLGGETLTALARSNGRQVWANVLAEDAIYHGAIITKAPLVESPFAQGWGVRLAGKIRRLA